MRTFFYITPLFRQCHCHKQQFFFLLCTFFCFCSQHFRIRIFYLCSEYLFFAICLHHFRIRILYLNLQRVSCTWFFSLISAMPLPQTTNFFFPSYSNSFPHFFPLNFSNCITTNYVLFFVFVFVHNTLE